MHFVWSRRNQNYRDIVKNMRNLGLKSLTNVVDLTNKFHHVFFFGDLNYRIADTDTNVSDAAAAV